MEERKSILDTVSQAQQSQALRTINPQRLVLGFLEKLSQREREILTDRFGLLSGGKGETLGKIGQKLSLTRERVRQIEKEITKKLRAQEFPQELIQIIDLIHEILGGNGGVATERKLVQTILPAENNPSHQAVLFILNLFPQFHLLKESGEFNQSWYSDSFDQQEFDRIVGRAVQILERQGKTKTAEQLRQSIENPPALEILKSFFEVTKKIDCNLFESWGLKGWPEIHPKDVGDKAYLVLLHHKKPEHYATITALINKQKFDRKVAHKETVHNELIKDKRFVLVGRGMYALKQWGYEPGTVGEIIESLLKQADQPLSREEIIDGVFKQRMVKRNTIIVGLSNRKRFKKLADGRFVIAETNV